MKRLFLIMVLCFGVFSGFSQDEKTAVDLKNEGNDALRAKDYKKAYELYTESLSKWGDEPTDTAMIYNAAYCAMKSKKYQKAVDLFDQSAKLEYKKSIALLYKAKAYQALDNDELYVSTLEEVLADKPNDKNAKSMLAKYYLKEGNVYYKKGAAILQAAAADVASGKYTTNDDQYKSASSNAKDEFKKALPLFEKGLEYNPSDEIGKQLKVQCETAIKG